MLLQRRVEEEIFLLWDKTIAGALWKIGRRWTTKPQGDNSNFFPNFVWLCSITRSLANTVDRATAGKAKAWSYKQGGEGFPTVTQCPSLSNGMLRMLRERENCGTPADNINCILWAFSQPSQLVPQSHACFCTPPRRTWIVTFETTFVQSIGSKYFA